MTKQILDKFIYDGRDYYLNEEILEYYFREFPERKPAPHGRSMSALWRGYDATFEVKENQLFITDIDWFAVGDDFSPEAFFAENFPDKKFSWFSGLIRIDSFRKDYDDEKNENAIYEILEFKQGDFITHRKMNHPDFLAFKDMLFERFKHTMDYKKQFGLWRKNNPHLEAEKINQYIHDRIISNVREL